MPAKPLSDEQQADAARLKSLFIAWQKKRKLSGLPWSQEWASDQLGFGQSATAQYLNGKIPLNLTAAGRFASLIECSLPEISPTLVAEYEEIFGTGPYQETQVPAFETNVAAAPALSGTTWLPVVGHVRAGPDGYLEEMQYPVGHGEGYVEYWTKDPAAYALRIKGDSMHPRYRAGEYIVVTPAIEPQPGRDVVVKLRTGQSMLKQLNWIRGGEIQLLSINNGYAPHTISLEDVESIQRVAGSVPPDAFTNERPLP